MGAVGQAIARRLAGFGARLLYSDPRSLAPARAAELRARRMDLDLLLAKSDFVILAVPFAPGSIHLIDERRITAMKQGAYLVNVGRGSVVDENAVARALQAGRLAGYAADVFAFEDWTRGDRPAAIPPALLASDRTLFTGHMGSAVDHVRRDIALAAAHAVLQALEGQVPEGAVNSPVSLAAPA